MTRADVRRQRSAQITAPAKAACSCAIGKACLRWRTVDRRCHRSGGGFRPFRRPFYTGTIFAPLWCMPHLRYATVHRTYIFLTAAGLLLAPHAAGLKANSTAHGPKSKIHSAAPTTNQQTLATQVALDRAGFSPGEIDGLGGTKT